MGDMGDAGVMEDVGMWTWGSRGDDGDAGVRWGRGGRGVGGVTPMLLHPQRLAGATLLVFANKQDLPGALPASAIREVRQTPRCPPPPKSPGSPWGGRGGPDPPGRLGPRVGGIDPSRTPGSLGGPDPLDPWVPLGLGGGGGGPDTPPDICRPPPPQALELDTIRSHHWCIQGCSAFTGHNLLAGIDWLLDDIASRLCPAD